MPTAPESSETAWRHFEAGRSKEAERICVRILDAEPQHGATLHLLGLIRQQGRRLDEAVELLRRAVRGLPEVAAVHNNLGSLLGQTGKYEESVDSFRNAIRLQPNYAEAYGNLGITHVKSGQIESALAAFRQAVRLAPDDPTAHKNLSRCLLLAGHLREGFDAYEWRLRGDPQQYPPSARPVWDGSPLAGRTILLKVEQGLGDTIQFVRYAPLLVRQGARVLIDCQPPLRALLESLTGPAFEIFDRSKHRDRVDVEAWLLSVPHLTGTELETIPAPVPYLRADAERVRYWRDKLPPAHESLRVGIAWQGSPDFPSDRQRSIPLSFFEPIARLPGVRLVSVQKGFGAEQLQTFAARDRVLDVTPQLEEGPGRAFTDTAALLTNLDLLVTSDTSVAHLAGALGVPVWLALPFAPDWRWLLARDDSPWYPTMRLFRQRQAGDWAEVFGRVEAELKSLAPTPKKAAAASVEVGGGELADRLAILRIKCHRIGETSVRSALEGERVALEAAWTAMVEPPPPQLNALFSALEAVNLRLWDVEDELRQCETAKQFGPAFVELARSVYRLNDHRSRLKARIDRLLGSRLVETKVYSAAPTQKPPMPPLPSTATTSRLTSVEDALRAFDAGRVIDARMIARRVLEREPDNARAVHLVGLLAHKSGNQKAAIEWMQRSIRLLPTIAAFHNNLGEALRVSERFEEALTCYREAIRLNPAFAEAHFNMGIAYRYLGQVERANECNERAVQLNPQDPEAHLNLSITRFLTGDLAGGFSEYEWRWKAASFGSPRRNFPQPQWAGEDLSGKTILVHAEQGFGDSIQFCRHIPLLRERGAQVTFEVQPEVKEVLRSSLDATVIARGEGLGAFDYHSPLLSLPRILGTTMQTVPAAVPYLRPDPHGPEYWSHRLRDNGRGGKRVGLVWAGRPTHKNDHNRSISLEQLVPLGNVKGIRFISLQQGEAAYQAQRFPLQPGGPFGVETYRLLKDFADTAAFLSNLDLLISVDTSVMHLAGALGMPVWMLNPFVCDWRWPLGRDDSPWYPTLRMFRQSKSGQWDDVVERVRVALAEL